MAEPAKPGRPSTAGLTLAEMKAAAAQAGIDPALVERAARLLRTNAAAKPSLVERMIGGRTRHGSAAHFPIGLDEEEAARLLSAVRIAVGRSGDGHSGPVGLTWRSADDGGGVLSITALTDHEGTSVTVDLDRRGSLAVVGVMTVLASFGALAFGGTVAEEIVPGLGAVGGLSAASAVVALARHYWASSTRAARERLDRVMDSVGRYLEPRNSTFADVAEKRAALEEEIPDEARDN